MFQMFSDVWVESLKNSNKKENVSEFLGVQVASSDDKPFSFKTNTYR